MKTFKLIIQVIGLFLMVYIGLSVVPNLTRAEINRSYAKDYLAPLIDNQDRYLEELASFNNYTYQKTPLFQINDATTSSSFVADGYLLASNTDSFYNNGIFIYIKDAKYDFLTYDQISLTVYYDKDIRMVKNEPVKFLDPMFITSTSTLRGFYISNYFFSEEVYAEITALKFGFKKGETILNEFLMISNSHDQEDIPFLFNHSLDSLNIDLKNHNLSSLISDPMNIPTDNEKELYNLYYKQFNNDVLKQYNYKYWLWVFGYLALISPIIYFGYIRSVLKMKKK